MLIFSSALPFAPTFGSSLILPLFVLSLRTFSPTLGFSILAIRMSETPFRPREKLIEKQKYFQSIHKHTYLKGPVDKITSVAIPLALAGKRDL
ncbi:uncharacterized protein [Primulina eburnea]|uniref:uncharacterized protein isoform X2 n=1 Tax=Primulina eburnea TaxID=1245227 RepID=UPI003C6C455A